MSKCGTQARDKGTDKGRKSPRQFRETERADGKQPRMRV